MKVLQTMEALVEYKPGREEAVYPGCPPQSQQCCRVLGLVEAGFPSPAEEELRDTISLDEFLIQNPEASFLLKVSGDSMVNAGILPGDMVIVDRGQTGRSGDIVIAEVDGEWTMKFLKKSGETIWLVPANPKYKPIRPQRELKIAGVVTAVVRKYQRGSGARGRDAGGGHAVETMENGGDR